MAELKKDQKPNKTRSKRLMPDQVAYIRIETMPGRQAQVDWAVFKTTEPSGRTSTVYLFLTPLGYCRAMYGEFVQRCTQESFLDCHKRAFHYLGGVPDEVLYDNMKREIQHQPAAPRPPLRLYVQGFSPSTPG